ncbi:MAG TPA: hypothetical protein VJ793_09060 [Anaerolineae bacterium]|nr:hypothetical protein [Anaerolineae bacterium]
MISSTRFIENETGAEVSVESAFGWPPLGHAVMLVTYASGRRYAVAEREFALHFTIVSPQEVFFRAFGVDDRPTVTQKALQGEVT